MTNRHPKHHAFTLVELMVSVALALLLLVGVNQVFKTTTTTVGTGYATSQVMRSHMAVEKVLARDFDRAVPPSEAPAIVIHSEQTFAFRDRADLNADRDGDVTTVDNDDNGTEGENGVFGEDIRPANYGRRSHRIDTVSFFARDINVPYRRQTGDQTNNPQTAPLIADESSTEAWIWFGHLRLPNNTPDPDPLPYQTPTSGGDYFSPAQRADTGSTTAAQDSSANPNNYFVNDWVFGRQAILLKSKPAGDHIQPTGDSLAPLGALSKANEKHPATNDDWEIRGSRFDIAATTISLYRQLVASVQSASPNNWNLSLDYRFNCKPWILKNTAGTQVQALADLSKETATATPFLTRGCTQFMVEFAGDFLTQNNDPSSGNYGDPTAVAPDGIIDFMVPPTGGGFPITRWYGFPRDVAGPNNAANRGVPDGRIQTAYDVVPVRDVIAAASLPVPVSWFEKTYPSASVPGDYLANGALGANARYVCAWGPKELYPTDGTRSLAPRMIRVVLQLTDSNNRLNEGQVVEYVYSMPQD